MKASSIKPELHIDYSFIKTKFGTTLVASTEDGICAVLFADNQTEALQDLQSRWPHATFKKTSLPIHLQIQKYFNTKLPLSKINFHLIGTDFQIKVWNALLTIPKGKTSTYTHIAKLIKSPQSVRAVGTAVGKNPIGYIIPCHRVLTSTGKIGGYRWGVERKRAMLFKLLIN